ncbi:hypothetical protein G6F31_015664 [Rhizopus arrhizus]|nr:hypothetical protein G6F31_015664 [Rhizopus arrhizus]
MRGEEVAHLRVHHFAPAAAAEDAVVTGTFDDEMLAAVCTDAGAQCLRRFGLAEAGDVVQLAFDAQQRGIADGRRVDLLAIDHPLATRQQEVLEHHADGVQVVLGRHVQHRVVFVVEAAMRFGVAVVAAQQVQVELVVRLHVAVGIHGHEPGMLQEARIHAATGAGVAGRHGVDDVVLEPRQRVLRGQVVHCSRAAARIDRAAHHHQRARRRFATAGHQRNRGQHRHGRLAHAHHVQALNAKVADEFLDVGDVVVQAELTFAGRHHARIHPVGDVHAVVAQQGAHGIAQQAGRLHCCGA